jgi:hypothetical protein
MQTLLIVMISATLCLAACDLFQTRDPEPPSNTTSTFNPPVNADIVVQNLNHAVIEANVDNYIRCLTSTTATRSFEFVPSTDVALTYASIFQEWTTDDERIYFRNLGTPSQGVPFLSFENQKLVFSSSDSVIYNMDYQLFYPHQSTLEPQFVRGNMQIHLGKDEQGRWSIYRWHDSKFPQDTMQTWSYLKAKFRIRS